MSECVRLLVLYSRKALSVVLRVFCWTRVALMWACRSTECLKGVQDRFIVALPSSFSVLTHALRVQIRQNHLILNPSNRSALNILLIILIILIIIFILLTGSLARHDPFWMLLRGLRRIEWADTRRNPFYRIGIFGLRWLLIIYFYHWLLINFGLNLL